MSAIGALVGLAVAIVLIIRKVSPVYSLLLGALVGGLLGGLGLEATASTMVSGVKDITPAIVRILAAGVLSGVLIKSGAAESISHTIVNKLGQKHIYLALALSVMLLTAVGVFIDVAVITVAPVAIMIGQKVGASRLKILLAMVGGGKCGNIISPNPNTIIAAENMDAPLSSVMGAGVLPAIVGLLVTIYLIIPLMPNKDLYVKNSEEGEMDNEGNNKLPSFWASIAGPLVAIVLLSLRPLAGIVVDPLIALPVGGIVGILTTRTWSSAGESVKYGLEKMSVVAVLLVGTGAIAGIIKASALTDMLISLMGSGEGGRVLLAPLSGALMSAATASTTAGATVASASFGSAILSSGVSAVWGAAMINAGATVLDHLPHGSFFHATGGSVEMGIKERLRLIPYESLVGLVLTLCSVVTYLLIA
ncbi:MAG: GntP family permease [Tidjanibacter sp.]|nr:GntP family permease [Tidjanibacter sp.]